MILHIAACPKCGGTSFAVEVKTWLQVEAADDHSPDFPRFGDGEFDREDADYADPIEGGEIICRNPDCQHRFLNSPGGPPAD